MKYKVARNLNPFDLVSRRQICKRARNLNCPDSVSRPSMRLVGLEPTRLAT